MTTLPKGIIFDMDGVLLDSEPFITKAAIKMFAELGLKVQPHDFQPFTGTGEDRFLGGVAEKYNFPFNVETGKNRTYDIYLEIIKDKLSPLNGAWKFIAKCRAAGKKLAIASSADMRKVKGNLAEIKINPDTFDAVITGSDVVHKKPAPDIFLLAAQKICLAPKDCLVVEDAPSGIAAAKAAGCKCLAITSSFTPDNLLGADFYAQDLANVPTDALKWK
ncbi:MAG: HAD-IA family hydrolase [Phycisphaerae bacterium]|jgi:HAD superfamily hydrolase (TIGR01509 family)